MCGVVKPNNLYPSISLGWQKCLLDPTLWCVWCSQMDMFSLSWTICQHLSMFRCINTSEGLAFMETWKSTWKYIIQMKLQIDNLNLHELIATREHIDILCGFTLKMGPSWPPSRTSDKYKHSTEESKILGNITQLWKPIQKMKNH
jgi:hypothetical protein